MTQLIKSKLWIRGLELSVYLGWPDKERQQQQIVLLDIEIQLPAPPKACLTDHLQDTLCYSTLITYLQETITNKKFHLIEHLTHEIYTLIKPRLPNHTKMALHLTKHPPIPGLTGGVCFSYCDE